MACTASPLWYPKSTTSRELSHLTSTRDAQRNENQVFWPPKQNDINAWSSVSRANGSLNLIRESTEDNKNILARSNLQDYQSPVSSKAANCVGQAQGPKKIENAPVCRLFGIDLRNNSHNISPSNIVSDRDGTNKEKMNEKQIYASSSRIRIKVQMQGIAVGRGVDMTFFNGYDDLIAELENMFEIKGELKPRNKWEVVYTDNEGDMMLVGDDPWPEFCKMARKICIYSSEEVKKMGPICELPMSTLEGEGTILSFES